MIDENGNIIDESGTVENGGYDNSYREQGNTYNTIDSSRPMPGSQGLLIAGIAMIVSSCCCCISGIWGLAAGIATLIIRNTLQNKWSAGDMEGYEKDKKTLHIIWIVAGALWVLFVLAGTVGGKYITYY